MRRSPRLPAAPGALLLTLLLATPARAVVLDFDAELRIEIAPFAPIVIAGSGSTDVETRDGSFPFPAGVFGAVTTRTGHFPGLSKIVFDADNAAGSFGPVLGGFGGGMPLSGTALFDFFVLDPGLIALPLRVIGAPVIDYAIGTTFSPPTFLLAALGGSRWTTGPALVYSGNFIPLLTDPYVTYTLMLAYTVSGTDQRTPSGAGQIQLVTPIFISAGRFAESFPIEPAFGRLTITFAPEPPSATMHAAALGAAALLAFGARARRRRGRAGAGRAAAPLP